MLDPMSVDRQIRREFRHPHSENIIIFGTLEQEKRVQDARNRLADKSNTTGAYCHDFRPLYLRNDAVLVKAPHTRVHGDGDGDGDGGGNVECVEKKVMVDNLTKQRLLHVDFSFKREKLRIRRCREFMNEMNR